MKQEQFLDVIARDEAERRFRSALKLEPLGTERVALGEALGRVLAAGVVADVDVPGFDRSNLDGYAVRAEDTFGASEEEPKKLTLNPELIATGIEPGLEVQPGTATPIATGAIVPRGADAVVMVEATDEDGDQVIVRRAITPGFAVSFAGSDIARGELVLMPGDRLTSRETGVLAAIGHDQVEVYVRPRVGILSTGDEIVAPGSDMRRGLVFDSNARALADAVRELGGEATILGIVPDDEAELRRALEGALDHDLVLLSGGTSKGPGDVAYRVLADLEPGVLAHGVALKPGKPLCLAASGTKPVVVLPGFPTSALFTFHEFVAPVIRAYAGRAESRRGSLQATLPVKVNSERGRTEYLLVNLVPGELGLSAYPLGKGSGSVTTWSRADGFCVIPQNHEILEEGATVDVTLLGRDLEPKDFVFIGSHCVGLDLLMAELRRRGYSSKVLAVGSEAGLRAARNGECDAAGIHLLDPDTDLYNEPFVDERVRLVDGYGRMQGLVFRRDDARFAGRTTDDAITAALADPEVMMVNRNRGSGTRVLIDRLLGDARPSGYPNEVRTHNAVAAAVAAGRADFGVAIDVIAEQYALDFLPLREERYDFVVPADRFERPPVRAFRQLLADPGVRATLERRGFRITERKR